MTLSGRGSDPERIDGDVQWLDFDDSRKPGDDALTAGTLALSSTANNYAMSFANPAPHNYVITTATLTITASAQNKTYGQTISFGSGSTQFTSSGLQGSDSISSVTLAVNNNGGAASAPVGSYTITPSAATGSGLGNYTITYDTGTLTVGAATLTITAKPDSKTYGQTVVFGSGSTAFTSSGLQNSETIGSVTLAVNNNGGAANAPVSGNPYTISPSAATGGTFTAGNYTITYDPGTLIVGVLPVTLSGTRIYDGTAVASASGIPLVVANLVSGDNVTVSGDAILASKNVGSEAISDAAATRVQSASGSTGGSAASSFTVTVAAPGNGNTLVAVISTRGTTVNRVSSITQTGATWVQATEGVNANGDTTEIWYAPNVSGAGTVATINLAAPLFASAVVAEYSGILTLSPLDQTANNSGNGTAATTGGTGTTVQGSEVWVGGIGLPGSSLTLGSILSSFNTIANAQSSSGTTANNANVYALDSIVSSTGTASSGGTISGGSSGTIAQRGTATTANVGSGTTMTINTPAGVVAGDVMIANIQLSDTEGSGYPSLSGWTPIATIDFDTFITTDYRAELPVHRVAGASEPSSYQFTIDTQSVSGASGAIVAFSGVNTGSPFDVTPGSYTKGSLTTSISVPAITTVTANDAIVMCVAATPGLMVTSFATTSPGSLTSLYGSTANANGTVGAGWGTKATTGTTGSGTATLSGAFSAWAGMLLALASRLLPPPHNGPAQLQPSNRDHPWRSVALLQPTTR